MTLRPAPSSRTQLIGYLAIQALTGFITLVNGALVVGTITYPLKVGVYAFLPYYIFTFVSRPELKHGDRWKWFSKSFPIFHRVREYLSLKLHVDDKLKIAAEKKDAQFVFGLFPHGSNADFRMYMDGLLPDHFPEHVANRMYTLCASILFRIPLVREIALWTGGVDASKKVAEGLLRDGYSFLVFPGGQMEQLLTEKGRESVYLKKRLGFVKLALRFNVPLVPVYAFGCTDYYNTSDAAFGFRLSILKYLGASVPLAWGMYGSMACPKPIPTTVVYGPPLELTPPKVKGNPTDEEVSKAHRAFCEALRKLFDEHKGKLGYADRQLEIN